MKMPGFPPPISVYRNLTRDCWSLKQGGKVIGHEDEFFLCHVRATVQPAGRERVRREGKKYVHAWLSGQPCSPCTPALRLHYNPLRDEGFCLDDHTLILSAERAHFTREGHVYIDGPQPTTQALF